MPKQQLKKKLQQKNMSDHIEEYFAKEEGTKESFNSRELFKADETSIDLKTHLTDQEITLINNLKFNDQLLKQKKLKPVFASFTYNYLRLKVSKDRLSRQEFVNINKKEDTEETLNKLGNAQNILSSKK